MTCELTEDGRAYVQKLLEDYPPTYELSLPDGRRFPIEIDWKNDTAVGTVFSSGMKHQVLHLHPLDYLYLSQKMQELNQPCSINPGMEFEAWAAKTYGLSGPTTLRLAVDRFLAPGEWSLKDES
jgi:hypothetical protein